MSHKASCESFDECVTFRSQITEWTNQIWHQVVAQIAAAQQQSPTLSKNERNYYDCTFLLPNLPETSSKVPQQLTVRPLHQSELEILRFNRNRIRDGSLQFLVHPATDQRQTRDPSLVFQHVYDNVLEDGIIVWIAIFNENSTVSSSAIERSKIRNSIVHLNADLDGSTISNSYIGSGAVVHCSRLLLSEGGSDNAVSSIQPPLTSLTCHVGAESGGGRLVRLTAESTMADVAHQLMTYNRQASSITSSPSSTDKDAKQSPVVNYITDLVQIHDTQCVQSVVCFPQSTIRGASIVEQVVLYPNATIGATVIARHCFLQWSAQIVDQSVVSQSVLMEHAIVGPQSRVNESILGPDVHVSCGEVHASIVGPNTNAHHQSLLIGILWLCGRGNVGYGANVGSNHTGRCPDQEAYVGEGVFWGLSCVVKLPISLAPYTIVAAGTIVPPQTMTMPFSLLVSPNNTSSRNQLLPGWVLGSSPYTIARAQIKLATRRKAYRHKTGWEIFRPFIIEQCVRARDTLVSRSSTTTNRMEGVGECDVSDKAQLAGVRAYTDCIHRYALHGLLSFLAQSSTTTSNPQQLLQQIVREFQTLHATPPSPKWNKPNQGNIAQWEVLPWQEDTSTTTVWTYQKALLHSEFPFVPSKGQATIVVWIRKLLGKLVDLESKYAKNVYECKRRDDVRGKTTIPGYEESHVAANDDPVVQSVRNDAKTTIGEVERMLQQTSTFSINPESKL